MQAGDAVDIHLIGMFGEEVGGLAGDVVGVDDPDHEAGVRRPFPRGLEVLELAALFEGVAGVGAVRWIDVDDAESPARRTQRGEVAAHGLRPTKALGTGGGAGGIEFVGVGRHAPRLGEVGEGIALPGTGIENETAPGS